MGIPPALRNGLIRPWPQGRERCRLLNLNKRKGKRLNRPRKLPVGLAVLMDGRRGYDVPPASLEVHALAQDCPFEVFQVGVDSIITVDAVAGFDNESVWEAFVLAAISGVDIDNGKVVNRTTREADVCIRPAGPILFDFG